MAKVIIALFVFATLGWSPVAAQHKIIIGLDWQQIDEDYNHGLIFDGAELTLGYGYTKYFSESKLDLESKLKFGFSESHEVLGFNISFQPIKVFYGLEAKYNDEFVVYYGLAFKSDYILALYPDLQMGHDFWISSFQLAPAINAGYSFDKDKLNFRLSLAALGLYSRPSVKKDEYNYSLALSDILSDMHSNMKFGTIGLATDLSFGVEYVFDKLQPDYSISYDFRYLLYFEEPKLRYLYHGMSFNYYMGDK